MCFLRSKYIKAITYQRKYSINQSAETTHDFTPCRRLLSVDRFREDKATAKKKDKELPVSQSQHFLLELLHLHLTNTENGKKMNFSPFVFTWRHQILKLKSKFLLLSAIQQVSNIYIYINFFFRALSPITSSVWESSIFENQRFDATRHQDGCWEGGYVIWKNDLSCDLLPSGHFIF